ncbi:MAG: hypothetical protein ACLFOY_11065 [Desulfatibacillaceae bacterium]
MEHKTGWFDKPKNVKIFLRVFFASLVVLLLVDFFIEKHPEFAWEYAPSFYAAYGFVSCVVLVLAAKVLRWFIKRDEDYYDH